MTTRVPVNPDLLHWALERAGMSADALAGKFPKLNDWLRGELAPTLKQLESFANATHTAIGLLFLPQPPEEPLPIPDFRTLPEARLSRPSADLLDTIYLCQQRQTWYRDHQRLHGTEAVAFVGSASVANEVSDVATRISETIGFDLAERRQVPNWSKVLRRFISQVEQAGILVMVSGVVGSNTHRPLNVEEFLSARTGKRFVKALVASTLEGQTQFTDAFRMLGIQKTATFYQEAQRLGLHG